MSTRIALASSPSSYWSRRLRRDRTHTDRAVTIYAAASLTDVFQALDPAQKYSFAGSNTLETQIRNGAPADLFASAAPLNTQRLFAQGLVDKPVTFTSNRLALIVPKSNPADLHSVYDLKRKPVKLVDRRRRRFRSGHTPDGAAGRWA